MGGRQRRTTRVSSTMASFTRSCHFQDLPTSNRHLLTAFRSATIKWFSVKEYLWQPGFSWYISVFGRDDSNAVSCLLRYSTGECYINKCPRHLDELWKPRYYTSLTKNHCSSLLVIFFIVLKSFPFSSSGLCWHQHMTFKKSNSRRRSSIFVGSYFQKQKGLHLGRWSPQAIPVV